MTATFSCGHFLWKIAGIQTIIYGFNNKESPHEQIKNQNNPKSIILKKFPSAKTIYHLPRFVANATIDLMQEKTTIMDHNGLRLGFLTNRVGRLLAIHLKNRLGKEEFDMPGHCLGILAELWEKDGIIQQDLAILIVKDKATIARTLDLMEKKNIIVRIKDEKDRRNKRIFLTHKGKQLQHKVMAKGDELLEDMAKGIIDEEMKNCLNTLDKIYHNLKEKL